MAIPRKDVHPPKKLARSAPLKLNPHCTSTAKSAAVGVCVRVYAYISGWHWIGADQLVVGLLTLHGDQCKGEEEKEAGGDFCVQG